MFHIKISHILSDSHWNVDFSGILYYFKNNAEDFMYRSETIDKTLVHQFISETKQE